MTLAEALAAANAGQQGAQFSAGGQIFVLPPGVQGAPIEDEPVVDPPPTVEEALAAIPLPLLEDAAGDALDTVGQVGGLPSLHSDLWGKEALTSLAHDPLGIDRNLAADIGTGLSIGNTLLGGGAGAGAVLSMAGQGVSAANRTSQLDDLLTSQGLPATPRGTGLNDFWSQGVTGFFGAGEPAQAAAAGVIGEELSRPFPRTNLEGALTALNQIGSPTKEIQAALREQGVSTRPTVGDLPPGQRPELSFFEQLFGQDLDALAPPPPATAAPLSAVTTEALANLAGTNVSTRGAALDMNAVPNAPTLVDAIAMQYGPPAPVQVASLAPPSGQRNAPIPIGSFGDYYDPNSSDPAKAAPSGGAYNQGFGFRSDGTFGSLGGPTDSAADDGLPGVDSAGVSFDEPGPDDPGFGGY